MRQMFIPTVGFEFVLAQPWTFELYEEGRNRDLLKATGLKTKRTQVWEERFEAPLAWKRHRTPEENEIYSAAVKEWLALLPTLSDHVTATLPAGTILKVDRIYIRKGKDEFDSVTFWSTAPGQTAKKPKKFRFWAKLVDVNGIVFED